MKEETSVPRFQLRDELLKGEEQMRVWRRQHLTEVPEPASWALHWEKGGPDYGLRGSFPDFPNPIP